MGVIIFNGISSESLGIQVETQPGYQYPERDYEVIHVPGRSGDVLIDTGSYKNVEREYQISKVMGEGEFHILANQISEWLHSANGYARLEDTYEPLYFRQAFYMEDGSVANILGQGGKATIKFVCKPQRYLRSGEQSIAATKETTIGNPTGFTAKPLFVVEGTGSGTLTVGNNALLINSIRNKITIDSELKDAYQDSTNRNSDITLSTYGFPALPPGQTTISFSGGITKVIVTPRWWTL